MKTSPFFLLIYIKKMNFSRALCTSFGVFSQKLSLISREFICNVDTFTKLSLSNIMKHCESDVEWQRHTFECFVESF